jgi:hypothetical protein
MRYLRKSSDTKVMISEWRYPGDAVAIREELLCEQRGFCAYSEKHVGAIDETHVEHFDPRLKGTSATAIRTGMRCSPG